MSTTETYRSHLAPPRPALQAKNVTLQRCLKRKTPDNSLMTPDSCWADVQHNQLCPLLGSKRTIGCSSAAHSREQCLLSGALPHPAQPSLRLERRSPSGVVEKGTGRAVHSPDKKKERESLSSRFDLLGQNPKLTVLAPVSCFK